jgi:ABC-type glycerol-3-phosphate transport system substrate-binding protein
MSLGVKRWVAAVLMLSVVGAGCTKGPDAATVAASKKADIQIWGVVDDGSVYEPLLREYRAAHPFANIEYRRFRLEEYEEQLLNAFAEDRGPDIFLIHNTWVGKYLPKILPMPASTKIAVQTVAGTVKKSVVYSLATEPTVSLRTFKKDYPDTVAEDMIRTVNTSADPNNLTLEPRVVGIPLSVDTLGMYVNKDLLNAAGISTIPETWGDFQTAVKKLVKVDANGDLLQSGAALGTGVNVQRSPDILSVLMMQNGAEMSAADGSPTFQAVPPALDGERRTPPALDALGFYTDFANPSKEVYTWNAKQPNSLDAFIQGKVAFFFGYSYDLPIIKARAPKLNIAIANLPQIEGNPQVNFANYWALTVSKKTKHPDLAWNILNALRKPELSQKYLDAANRPAALRSQLSAQLEKEDLGVFAAQVLTAKSWYRGTDPRAADAAFVTLIDSSLAGGPEFFDDALRFAAEKIAQTVR